MQGFLAVAPVKAFAWSTAFSLSVSMRGIVTLSLILLFTLVAFMVPADGSICFGAPCCCKGDQTSDSKEQILMDATCSAVPVTAAQLRPG